MVIRAEQMRTFESEQAGRFANELVTHIEAFAPAQCAFMGKEAVRNTIGLGLRNAQEHGFTLRGPTRFYVEAMFMLGSLFDSDPQYRDLTRALFDQPGSGEIDRADRLYGDIVDYVDRAAGPRREYEIRASNRAIQMRYEDLAALAGRPTPDLVHVLSSIYPEKVQALGEPAILALADEAAAATQDEPSWAVARPLFAELMFILGHGCLADPQYPWIAGTLEDARPSGATMVLERLFQKFLAFLTQTKSTLAAR